ncbi:MAG TPA: TetR family transcriptional regulator [Chthoniobacterales bacterium]|jgi:TetR/AcrR family transcriptional repressor of nem operon|nr:TetR family transcriptional regulator [Chthoniobacterales bacterium]
MKLRLMDAAMDLMWENSYNAMSVDAICERAVAKKGSFYYFFKSKSELAAAALEADWAKKKAEMDSIFSPTVPPLERFDRYFDFVHDRLAQLQKKCGSILGCPFVSVGSEVSTQDQSVRETIDRIMDTKLNYFISTVRDAQAQRLIDAPDPVAKAKALFSCYQGTMAQARIQNDVELLREFKKVARDLLGVKRAQTVPAH